MADFSNLADLFFTDDGDLQVDAHGDIDMCYGVEVVKDDVFIRLETNAPEFYYHPLLGATFEDLIGQPNTPATGADGESRIREALTYDGYIIDGELTIYTIPVNQQSIMYYVSIISEEDKDIVIPYVVNL
jgi:hypothetical protein